MTLSQQKKQENLIYTIVWSIVFLTPLVSTLLKGSEGSIIKPVLSIWGNILPFLLLFLAHNFLALPLLGRKKHVSYACLTAVLVAGLALVLFSRPRPEEGPGPGGPPQGAERVEGRPQGSPGGFRPGEGDPGGFRPGEGDPGAMQPFRPENPPRPLDPSVMKFLLGLLMLVANFGVRSYFRGLENEQRMEDLEKENLHQQLEYLRYQINPHFFMNTLNNIHALVDIDPEQAKSSIVELSRLMRHILYEGEKPTIPLDKETDFLRHYVSLMRLRYADTVRVDLELPEETGGIEVPPLVFVSFVENAFKHGVSYEEPSFIRVSMQADGGKLIFKCANSRHLTHPDDSRGIGQENVRRRLDLLYGSSYTLHYDVRPDVYDVLLVLPVLPEKLPEPAES